MIKERHLRILVVEDNPQDVFLLRAALSGASFPDAQLLVAERVADALSLLEKNTVDLILTDLNLPDSTGLETVRTLARKGTGAPLLVLTGHSDPEMERELVKCGASGQFSKDSLHTPALKDMLQKALAGQHRKNGKL